MVWYGFEMLKPESVVLSQKMLSLGAEYVNLDIPDPNSTNTLWYAGKAAKITEFAEGTFFKKEFISLTHRKTF